MSSRADFPVMVTFCNHCDKTWGNPVLLEIHYLVDHPESHEAGIYSDPAYCANRPLHCLRNW